MLLLQKGGRMTKEISEKVREMLKEIGLDAEELVESKKAHIKRMKKLDRQIVAAMAKRNEEVR
jgi:menaquinone-dependent protoporphyrinogen IX oxidase